MPDLTSSYTDEQLARLTAAATTQTKDAKSFQRDATNLVASWATPGWVYTPPPPPVPVPPVAAGSGWRLTFEDTFTGTSVDPAKWGVMHESSFGQSGNQEVQWYMRENATVSGGTLKLTATWDTARNRIHSGMLTHRAEAPDRTQRTVIKPGAYVEIRSRCENDSPVWPSIWLVGAQGAPGWPAYGEIDIFEGYATAGGGVVESNYHWSDNGTHQKAGARPHTVAGGLGAWHTYAVQWERDRLRYFYDGVQVREIVPATSGARLGLGYDHVIRLNLAYGGAGPIWHGHKAGTERSFVPSVFEVDHVRVWQH